MVDTVNFLKLQHRKVTKIQKLDRRIFNGVALVTGIIVACSLLAVGLAFFFQFQLGRAEAKIIDLEREILANEEIEKSAVVLVKKISVLQGLLDERQDKQQAIEYFTNLFGDDIIIEDINYQSADSILSLRLQIPSVFRLEDVYALLTQPATVDQYGMIHSTELRRDVQGAYSMNIIISLENENAS